MNVVLDVALVTVSFGLGVLYGCHVTWQRVVARINELESNSTPCPTCGSPTVKVEAVRSGLPLDESHG